MRDVFDRLHCAMAATTLPPFLVAAAVLVHEGWTQPGINALVVSVAMFLASPAVASATPAQTLHATRSPNASTAITGVITT